MCPISPYTWSETPTGGGWWPRTFRTAWGAVLHAVASLPRLESFNDRCWSLCFVPLPPAACVVTFWHRRRPSSSPRRHGCMPPGWTHDRFAISAEGLCESPCFARSGFLRYFHAFRFRPGSSTLDQVHSRSSCIPLVHLSCLVASLVVPTTYSRCRSTPGSAPVPTNDLVVTLCPEGLECCNVSVLVFFSR